MLNYNFRKPYEMAWLSALSRQIERMRTEFHCLFAAIDLQCNSVIFVLLIPHNFLFLIRMEVFRILIFWDIDS